MSNHPNVLLIAVLTPDGLARKTMKSILSDNEACEHEDDSILLEPQGEVYQIGDQEKRMKLRSMVMEGEYDDDYQIAAKEGDLVFFSTVTYGYGEAVPAPILVRMIDILERWCKATCEKHHCAYSIKVSANYW